MNIVQDDSSHLVTVDFNWLIALGFAVCWSVGAVHIAMDSSSRWNIAFAAAIFIVGILGANQFAVRIVFDFDKSSRQLAWSST